MVALLIGAAATLAALLAARPALGRPTFAGGSASSTGDDLAVACVWWCAVLGSLWLAATTLACVAALARGRTRAARRIARFAPPLVRRVLQAALITGWGLVPTSAYAAPPSVPITVHVDTHGRLTTDTRQPTSTTVRSATRATTTTTTTTVRPAAPHPTRPRRAVTPPARSPAPTAVPGRGRLHVVLSGENLWLLARAEVIRAGGTDRPDDAEIAPYWRRVIEANRTTLRSGNPSLIFPGEVVTLPLTVH
jgi:hypothetical protein